MGERTLFKQLRIATSTLFALAATAAGAQSAPATGAAPASADVEPEGLATIIVTATKQATPLQTTPIAITAVTAEQLQQRSIETASDLGAIVPNANFREAQGAYGPGLTAFIRGIGQADTNLASEPGVAFYVTMSTTPWFSARISTSWTSIMSRFCVAPQGTLFGRNALAGAVNMVGKQRYWDNPLPWAKSPRATTTTWTCGLESTSRWATTWQYACRATPRSNRATRIGSISVAR